jgi:hypothetical protein
VAASWQTGTISMILTEGSFALSPGRGLFVILGYTAVVLAFGFIFVRIRDVQ